MREERGGQWTVRADDEEKSGWTNERMTERERKGWLTNDVRATR